MVDFAYRYVKFRSSLMTRDTFGEETRIFEEEIDIRTMIRYMWGLPEFHKYIEFSKCNLGKDDDLAIKLRSLGNGKYKGQEMEEALKLYNWSVLDAVYPEVDCPSNASISLACAFSNRSAVFYEMKRYDLCLTDIRRAMNLNYPINMHDKLIKREIKCHIAKNELDIAKERYNVYIADVKYMNNQELLRSLKDIMSEIKEEATTDTEEHSELNPAIPYREVPPMKNANTLFPSASDAIEMTVSPEMGRGLIAKRDILPGEVILQEKAICSTLMVDCIRKYCSNCLKEAINAPISCRTCCNVFFCDEACREEAYKLFHKVECPMISALKLLNMGSSSWLSLRLFCQLGAKDLLKKFQLHETGRLNISEEGVKHSQEYVYQSDDIMNVFDLKTNKHLIGADDLMEICAKTLLILKLLATYTESELLCTISDRTVSTLTDDQISLAACIFLFHLNVFGNGHSITTIQVRENVFSADIIGSGLFLTQCILNHSCDPNTEITFFGHGAIVRAWQLIKAGSEVLSCYCDDFYTKARANRMEKLNRLYYFNCNCMACKEDWPTYDRMSEEMNLKCPCCSSKLDGLNCVNCKSSAKDLVDATSGIHYTDLISKKSQLLTVFRSRDIFDSKPPSKDETHAAKSLITFINQYCITPSKQLFYAQITLKRAMANAGYSSPL